MRRLSALAFGLVLSLTTAIADAGAKDALPVQVDAARGEYTLIVLPDTQRYASMYPDILWSQLEWVRRAAPALNTRMVIQVGDLVDNDVPAQWSVVDHAFSLLDDKVPYLVVPGNHDFSNPLEDNGVKSAEGFNATFSPYRFKRHPWYGGHYGASGQNSFSFFEAAGQKFLVLGLEWGPSDEVLRWAAEVIRKHKDDYRVILVTHGYMNNDDTRLGEGDASNPHTSNKAWNDGEEIWAKLVKGQANIDLVLSGHVLGDGTGLLVSKTDKGAPVVQMLANYQMQAFGGGGWLRILKFKPREGKLEVYSYSPWYGRLRTEPDQQFVLDTPWMFARPAKAGRAVPPSN